MTETEIIEFYSETKEEKEQENNDELTADGLPTLKKQLEMIEEDEHKNPYIINEETEKRNLLQSVKMLGLYNMGLDVFTDTRHINRFTREKLQAEIARMEEEAARIAKQFEEAKNKFRKYFLVINNQMLNM
jgi:hypothetical protein